MRHAVVFALVLSLSSLGLAGCLGQTPAAKMQETARDMNLNMRFGRMELVVEQVSPGYRVEFIQRHRAWGSRIRVADTELVGLRYTTKDAESMVTLSWYDVADQELRSTTVRQRWVSHDGAWLLDSEEAVEGERGLFGEPVARAPRAPRETAQFPTIRIP